MALQGEGEAAVRTAFSAATIVRPSIAFGWRTISSTASPAWRSFFQSFPSCAGRGRCSRSTPPISAKRSPSPRSSGGYAGQTYELGGPQVLTMHELNQWICREIAATGRCSIFPIRRRPAGAAHRMAAGRADHRDQWLMLQRDMSRPAPDSKPSESAPRRSPRWLKAGLRSIAATDASPGRRLVKVRVIVNKEAVPSRQAETIAKHSCRTLRRAGLERTSG